MTPISYGRRIIWGTEFIADFSDFCGLIDLEENEIIINLSFAYRAEARITIRNTITKAETEYLLEQVGDRMKPTRDIVRSRKVPNPNL